MREKVENAEAVTGNAKAGEDIAELRALDVLDEVEADVLRRAEAQYSTARAKVLSDIRGSP